VYVQGWGILPSPIFLNWFIFIFFFPTFALLTIPKKLGMINDFLTVKELSKWIKLSNSKIYSLVHKDEIPFAKIGGKLLFDKSKISNWIESKSNGK
jgi:excisionase family DNA binding protein